MEQQAETILWQAKRIAELESQEPVEVAFSVKREAIEICKQQGHPEAAHAIQGLLAVNAHVDPATPPQEQRSCDKRTWVGLTEGDMLDAFTLAEKATVMRPLMLGIFARAIEAKLKEKNT